MHTIWVSDLVNDGWFNQSLSSLGFCITDRLQEPGEVTRSEKSSIVSKQRRRERYPSEKLVEGMVTWDFVWPKYGEQKSSCNGRQRRRWQTVQKTCGTSPKPSPTAPACLLDHGYQHAFTVQQPNVRPTTPSTLISDHNCTLLIGLLTVIDRLDYIRTDMVLRLR